MQDEKKTDQPNEPQLETVKVEKKIPVIIELGESNLDDVAGGLMAYRCQPGG